MLIAMVLTLILVYSIAEFYAYVGETIKDGRAMIAMSSQLRGAIQRLKADLDQITVPMTPPVDDSAGGGYFEIAEGHGKDWDAANLRNPDLSWISGSPPANEYLQWESLYGDIDDVIAFTARSKREPWTGQVIQVNNTTGDFVPASPNDSSSGLPNPPLALPGPSFLAEIVWWTNFVDSPLNVRPGEENYWQYNEPRVLQRRQLLIRPDLNVVYPGNPGLGAYYFRVPTYTGSGTGQLDYYTLMQFCDVSIRLTIRTGGFDYYVANSLADLARRENRYMHRFDFTLTSINKGFPNFLDLNPNYVGNPSAARIAPANIYSQHRWVLDGDRRGEDVALSNLLAFDVRVFDPTAPLLADNADPYYTSGSLANSPLSVIQPGDPGWFVAATGARATYPVVGYGAYVDLFNSRADATPGATIPFRYAPILPETVSGSSGAPAFPRFAGIRTTMPSGVVIMLPMDYKSQLANDYNPPPPHPTPPPIVGTPTPPNAIQFAYYDTWAKSYEMDSINQDQDTDPVTGGPLIDEGTDGLDQVENIPGIGNAARNGVDDINERETAPPYAYPLRGVEITIRMYEPGTRQVRQATVGADFIAD